MVTPYQLHLYCLKRKGRFQVKRISSYLLTLSLLVSCLAPVLAEAPATSTDLTVELEPVEEAASEEASLAAGSPLIVDQPWSEHWSLGETVTFTIGVAEGTAIQWQYDNATGDWTNIPENKNWHGTKTETLTFTATASRAKYLYRAVVTLGDASEISSEVRFYVCDVPEFITQPQHVYAALNDTVTFTAEASEDPSYQWQYDNGTGEWTNIPENKNWHGTQTGTLTFTAISSRTRYHYRVIASNLAGQAVSDEVSFTIVEEPTEEPTAAPEPEPWFSYYIKPWFYYYIEEGPLENGQPVTVHFVFRQTGDYPHDYPHGRVWRMNLITSSYIDISETEKNLTPDDNTITCILIADNTVHYIQIEYEDGTIEQFVFKLPSAPVFSAQPQYAYAALNDTVTFTAEASEDPSYQWQYDNGTGVWTDIPENKNWHGTQTDTLTFTAISSREKYRYRVIASNLAGQTVSDEVGFTIGAKPPQVFIREIDAYQEGSHLWLEFSIEKSDLRDIEIYINDKYVGYCESVYSFLSTQVGPLDTYGIHTYDIIAYSPSDGARSILETYEIPVSLECQIENSLKEFYLPGETVTITAMVNDSEGKRADIQWQYDSGVGEWTDVPENEHWHGTQTKQLTFTANEENAYFRYRFVASVNSDECVSNEAGYCLVEPLDVTGSFDEEVETVEAGRIKPIHITAESFDIRDIYLRADGWSDYDHYIGRNTGSGIGFDTVYHLDTQQGRYSTPGVYTLRLEANYTFNSDYSVDKLLDTMELRVLPAILTQPKNQYAELGEEVTFTAKASEGVDLRWQYDGGSGEWTDIPENKNWHGTTTNTLTFAATASRAKQKYRVIASCEAGETVSQEATLTIGLPPAPVFIRQPHDVWAQLNKTVIFTAKSEGDPDYQWQFDTGSGEWTDIPESAVWHGTQTDTLSFTALNSRAAHRYRVVATNRSGEAVSDTVILTIGQEPEPTEEPIEEPTEEPTEEPKPLIPADICEEEAVTVEQGKMTTVDLTVLVPGEGGFCRLEIDDIGYGYYARAGVETPIRYTVNAASLMPGRYPRRLVAINNTTGERYQDYFDVIVSAFIAQPQNQRAAMAETVTFTAEAIEDVSYQWQYDGGTGTWTNIPENKNWHGTKTNTLTFTATTSRSKQRYRVIVTNGYLSEASKEVTFTLPAVPVITRQPAARVALAADSSISVTLTAQVTGADTLRWQCDGGNGSWTDIPEGESWQGTDTDTLSFTLTVSRARQRYRLVAVNGLGETVSAALAFSLPD